MNKLIVIAFFSLLLVQSCTCNDKTAEETAGTDTLTTPDGTGAADSASIATTTTDLSGDPEFNRLYNLKGYTLDEVREYRRMHDEMDWGNVPGFYPEGSTRPLTENDTKYLTVWGHKVMLNEIYARHGQAFTDPDLQEFFNNKEWYNSRRNNVDSRLTAQEKANIAFLNEHQPL